MQRKTLVLLALTLTLKLSAQNIQQASIAIGEAGNDAGNAIIQTTHGGYAIAGYTSCTSCPKDLYVIKLDSAANLQWTTSVGGSNDDYGQSLIQTEDSGYAIAGFTSSYGTGGGGIYIVKLNASGKLAWSKTVQGQQAYSIVQTTDKGFAVAGYTKGCSHCPTKAYLLKLDSVGNMAWSKTIGGTSDDTAYAVIQTKDGGYAVAGTTSSFGAGKNDMYLVKLDPTGTLQWSKTVGDTGSDVAYSVIQTHDKGYALAGTTTSFGGGKSDTYVVKMDSVGSIQWTTTLGAGNNDICKSMVETSDHSYILAGTTYISLPSESTTFVVKLDSTGNMVWNNTHRGGVASLNSIIATSTGGYAATGSTAFFGSGGNDVYFLSLDSLGNTCITANGSTSISTIDSGKISSGGSVNAATPIVSIDTSASDTGGLYTIYCTQTGPTVTNYIASIITNSKLFPNPATSNITLQYESDKNEALCIKVIDMAGNILYSSANNKVLAGTNTYNINTSSFAQGMYIVKIQSSQKTFYEKFVKL